MKELSLNILDISQNSVKASATKIDIVLTESAKDDLITIKIIDNGSGMSPELLSSVIDPFVTTRTTRKVGLGIPLLRQLTIDTQGEFDITSRLGEGTSVFASFKLSHLDRPPIGDMPSTIVTIISSNPDIRYVYTHKTDVGEFVLDTDEIKETLDGIPISEPEILVWLGGYLTENLNNIEGGNI